MEVGLGYINRCVGTALDAPAIAKLLSCMALDAEVAPGGEAVRVRVPPTRSDVLHACDVMEVWIASVLAQHLVIVSSSLN